MDRYDNNLIQSLCNIVLYVIVIFIFWLGLIFKKKKILFVFVDELIYKFSVRLLC